MSNFEQQKISSWAPTSYIYTIYMHKSDLPSIPPTPGIYIFRNKKGVILYIWKAKNLNKRVGQYFSPGSVWKQDMVQSAHHVEFIEVGTEEEALLLEEQMIKQYKPEYNRLLKYNSKYVWIRYSKSDFPKVTISRRRRDDWAVYIWPKASNKDLYDTLRYLRSLYQRRTMNNAEFKQGKLNLDFHLWLDAWRSAMAQLKGKGAQEAIDYAAKYKLTLDQPYTYYVAEYQKRLDSLQQVLDGDTQWVLEDISTQIEKHVAAENYEYCSKLRDIYTAIASIESKRQHISVDTPVSGYIAKIAQIHKYRVIILIKVHMWTIVDVIREQILVTDISLDSLTTQLKLEFDMQAQRAITEHGKTLYAKTIVWLGKSNRKEFDTLLAWFLDSFVHSSQFGEQSLLSDTLVGLKERYGLHTVPYHMECLDISHLSGDNISAGLSCMIGGTTYPKWYRNYKIQSVAKGKSDDYKSLSEVLVRRFRLGKVKEAVDINDCPDLFILDGGIWQLGILRELRQQFPELVHIQTKTQFVSLGKWAARTRKGRQSGWVEELYMYDAQDNIYSIPLVYDQMDRLLIKIRDESHRFANRYRKKRMKVT